jgi:thiamine pyrophosphate-dependent acetolactate synthase large subunit-like protein
MKMPQTQEPFPIRRLVVVVGDGEVVGPAASRALADLAEGRALDAAVPAAGSLVNDDYQEVVRRGRRFLDQAVPADPFTLLTVDSLAAVPDAVVRAAEGQRAALTLLVLDHHDHRYSVVAPDALNEEMAKLAQALGDAVEFEPGPYTVQVYAAPDIDAYYSVGSFTQRWMPEQAWVVAADIACAFVDSVQLHFNARLRRAVTPKPSTVANALADFLTAKAGSDWGLGYYTGSGVATFIDELETRAIRNGNPVVRGPSEHSLACSALARWRLDGAPFAIVVTTGMHEEFRGTLGNHVAARTKGFFICGDSRPDQWHPFQGTIHRTEDSRPSLEARGFPVVYIGRSNEITRGLAEAFAAYDAGRGPVMVIATREVLQASVPLGELPPPAEAKAPRADVGRSAEVEELATLLNTAPRSLLCQVGPLSDDARDLLYALARKAGIGLVDSVAQPGTVNRHHDGRIVAEYLGTLSMYGHSARVSEYLFKDGAPRPADEQTLMFIGTPIPQIDVPFSEANLRKLAPVQITPFEVDRAPFSGLSIVGDIEDVLRALHERLDVDPEVLAHRRAALDSTRDYDGDVIGLLPVLPMTTNHFFRRLRGVLEDLIGREGYRYTGVYDVGRAGMSAAKDLPRTGPAFSGWFGRALMGDATMSLPGVVTRRNMNVLSFVGDGAANMVPDIVPALVQQIVADHSAFDHNLSIFRLVNGAHSVIRTYREGIAPGLVTGQTGVLSFTPEDYERRYGSLTVRHRRVRAFDDVPFAEQLTERDTVNLYSVIIGHNNEGDGLGRLSALGWQRDELSSRALAMAGYAAQKR